MHNKQLEKTKNNKMKKRIKQILSVSLTILVSTMLVAGVATAVTTLSENIATGGTLTVTGTSTLTEIGRAHV